MTEINLAIARGKTYLARLTIERDDVAADLSAATVSALIKLDYLTPDASAALTLTLGNGLTAVDAAAGIYDLEITPARTALLSAAKPYVWELRVAESGGRIFPAAAGDVLVSNQVVLATS